MLTILTWDIDFHAHSNRISQREEVRPATQNPSFHGCQHKIRSYRIASSGIESVTVRIWCRHDVLRLNVDLPEKNAGKVCPYVVKIRILWPKEINVVPIGWFMDFWGYGKARHIATHRRGDRLFFPRLGIAVRVIRITALNGEKQRWQAPRQLHDNKSHKMIVGIDNFSGECGWCTVICLAALVRSEE